MLAAQDEHDDDWPTPDDVEPASQWQYWRPICNLLATASLTLAGFLLHKLAPDKVRTIAGDSQTLCFPLHRRMNQESECLDLCITPGREKICM